MLAVDTGCSRAPRELSFFRRHNAYTYVFGDPVNGSDLSGQLTCGNPPGHHHHGFSWGSALGLGLGALSAGLGVVSSAMGPTPWGLALGGASALLGVAGGVLDYGSCQHGDKTACLGLGLSEAGTSLGLFGLVGGGALLDGVIPQGGLMDSTLGAMGGLGLGLSLGGFGVDAGSAICSML